MHNHCIKAYRPPRRSLSEIRADMARLRQEIAALQQPSRPQATRKASRS
jgi:hypothetical protein